MKWNVERDIWRRENTAIMLVGLSLSGAALCIHFETPIC